MKFVSFRSGHGHRFGVVQGGVVEVLGGAGLTGPAGLREWLAGRGLSRGEREVFETVPFEGLDLAPVIPDPGAIFCVGLNYAPHIAEMGRDMPTHPAIFMRLARGQVGHGDPIVVPKVSDKLDFEGELAVVIGKPGRYIPEEQALEHVAGYACYNDGSLRDFQRHTGQFTPGKNFHATGAFGPVMVTPDEFGDVASHGVSTRLNGEVMQQAPFSDLVFSVPALIAYLSSFSELHVGDVIITGTPGGVGTARKPPLYMKAGDVVEVEIDGIGTLSNPVVAEADAGSGVRRAVNPLLTFACGRTDRTEALFSGAVSPAAARLAMLALPPSEIFPRALNRAEFDVCELSASSYLVQASRGESEYVAIPAFLSRSFRLDAIYVRSDREIETPADLAERRVGTPEFQMTAGVWVRGILKDQFGLDPRRMSYVTGGLNVAGRRERIRIEPAPGFRVDPIAGLGHAERPSGARRHRRGHRAGAADLLQGRVRARPSAVRRHARRRSRPSSPRRGSSPSCTSWRSGGPCSTGRRV